MADTFSAFQTLKDAGFDDKASAAIVRQIALALPETAHCDRETIADGLCDDQEFSVAQAEILADILSHCYWGMRFCQKGMRFRQKFNPKALKTALVRAKMPNLRAEAVLGAVDPFIRTARNNEVLKPVQFAPGGGQVFMCDFSFLRKPEMQKQRRAIILSPKSMNQSGRCTVVPVSMTPPRNEALHHRFEPAAYDFFHKENPVWAVCDHIYTFSWDRLWFLTVSGKPQTRKLEQDDYLAVQKKVAAALQFGFLQSAPSGDKK